MTRLLEWRNRFICLFLIFVVTHASAQVVNVPDPNLNRAVREALEIPDNVPITQQQMLELTGFAAEAVGVENITGLEYAINLKNLYLRNNPIKNLTPIANLTQLELLHLPGAPIKDLTPIQNLRKLKHLTLSHCEITDITPIQNLTALVFANLSVNRIIDISPLANLTALETLWIDVNQIVDISPLANLTQLKELDLHSNRIVDISPLANLTQLKELDLYTNRIVDISPLANLTQLQKLDLTYNQIVDVSPLANLTALEILWMPVNRVLDFSPLQGLSLIDFTHDEVCVLPHPPIRDRIENRNLPSIIQAWDDGIQNLPTLSYYDRIAYHDLFWHHLPFALRFQQTPPWHHLAGDLEVASVEREKLVSKNPNMLFLVAIRLVTAALNRHYPEDWPYWLRDEDGNLVSGSSSIDTSYLIDFRLPEVQNIVVQQAIAVARCGVYDGIMFDRWLEDLVLLTTIHGDQYLQYEGTPEFHKALEEERQARVSILKQIREAVPDDFLIICNNNWNWSHLAAPYINGGMIETFHQDGYTNSKIADIEESLLWYEENVREPKINVLRGEGLETEPPDSPDNRRWMRLFTTMSLTCSDGYALYTIGGYTADGHKQYQNHIWYDFWDANLGQPISPTAQLYQGIPSLYIRKFTNGWAVYNRSGQAQTISLPSAAAPVSDRDNNALSTTHRLPDLDGEIYLKTPSLADVNGDGVVNILDLVQVANSFGKSSPDLNGDGVVNILDLVFVAQQFSQ